MTLSIEELGYKFADPNRIESVMELIAQLSEEDRQAYFGDVLDREETIYDWNLWGRPKQLIPDEPYFNVHLLLCGRGFGKTRAMAEWIRQKAYEEPGCRIGILGRTAADTRDVMVTGESGILNIPQPESQKPWYKPSEAVVEYPNKSVVKLMSAENPDGTRGQQFHYSVVDEFAAHTPFVGVDGLTAFQSLRLATRLGDRPMVVVATTPKKVKPLRDLVEESKDPEKSIRLVQGKTSENSSNLSSVYMDVIHGSFDGTSLARQELDGEMLDEEIEGALWDDSMIKHRYLSRTDAMRLPLRLVAVDPTVAEKPKDECGIVVVGGTINPFYHKRSAYVLADETIKASPEVWAQTVIDAFYEWQCHGIIVEKNQGNHLLKMALKNIDPAVASRIFLVQAKASKKLRAEPISQVYEQGRVFHAEPGYPLLESQMTTWEPDTKTESPDRVDALVHGLTAILLEEPKGLRRRKMRANTSATAARLPSGLGTGRTRTLTGSRF